MITQTTKPEYSKTLNHYASLAPIVTSLLFPEARNVGNTDLRSLQHMLLRKNLSCFSSQDFPCQFLGIVYSIGRL